MKRTFPNDQRRAFNEVEVLSASFFRDAEFDRASINVDKRTVEVAFSSTDKLVDRWYGFERLSHEPGAIDMARLGSGRANLLVNHDRNDWVGVIESARIDDRSVGRAVVRFGNSPRAEQIFQDVRDGILTSTSVGYRSIEAKLARSSDEGDEYLITRWMPFEISLVTVPADETVGVGRSADIPPAGSAKPQEKREMSGANPAGTAAASVTENNPATAAAQAALGQGATSERVLAYESERRQGIENLCRMNNIDDQTRDLWITSGASMHQVSTDMLRLLEERGKNSPKVESRLGLSAKETRQFSVSRAILACSLGNWAQAGFEAECSRSIAQKLGRTPEPNKLFVPFEVQERAHRTPVEELAYALMKRDLTVASAGAGGYLVETANIGFVELLRNRSVLFGMGARRLSGLTGNVSIPKQTGAGTAVWLANEASTITESQQTFTQIALVPKTVGAYTEISRLLLMQSSPDAEGVVMLDLATVLALAIDLAGLNGSGSSGQPTGILQTAGIGSVTGTSMDYADIVEFQTDVFAGNALYDSSGYVTTGAVAGLLKQRVKFSSTASPIWDGRLEMANVDGYRGMASNQMPSATMLFGAFSEVIVGEWGVLELEVNPFANFQAGIIGVRAIETLDIGVRYPTAFSAASSIT